MWPDFMERLQAARNEVGRPFHILSAHRCSLHNARIGGAPLSQHLRLAVDISLHGHNKRALRTALPKGSVHRLWFLQHFSSH